MTPVRNISESMASHARIRLFRQLRGWRESLTFGLPLFQRDLIIQAHRTRTFVLRAVFASAMFLVALFYSAASSGTSFLSTAFGITGQGRWMLEAMVGMLFLAVYLLGPALACGALTEEKERNSLFLLYLTKLGPWQVVLEKFLSRLVPMFGILLLSLPLLAFSYTFGGLTQTMIGTAIWFVALSTIQVISIAVMCSSICRSTARSFLMTYLVLLGLSLGPGLVDQYLCDNAAESFMERWERQGWNSTGGTAFTKKYTIETLAPTGQLALQTMQLPASTYLYLWNGPALFSIYADGSLGWVEEIRVSFSFYDRPMLQEWHPVTLAGLPILFSAIVSLLVARCCVYLPDSVNESAGRVTIWQAIKSRWLEQSIQRGVASTDMLSNSQPEEGNPISWRESSKGLWGQSQNWFRFLLLVEIPTLFAIVSIAGNSSSTSATMSELILFLWVLSALLITVHASLLVTRERSRQTLELLLTTPLTSGEIARQKLAGTFRLIILCSIPLITCLLFQAWWKSEFPQTISGRAAPTSGTEYFITALICVGIYLPLVAWIALWMGLKYPYPTRATTAAIAAVGGLCVIPAIVILIPVLLLVPFNYMTGMNFVPLLMAQSSPITMLVLLEFSSLREISSAHYVPTIMNAGLYGYALIRVRRHVLEQADVLLGRKLNY